MEILKKNNPDSMEIFFKNNPDSMEILKKIIRILGKLKQK